MMHTHIDRHQALNAGHGITHVYSVELLKFRLHSVPAVEHNVAPRCQGHIRLKVDAEDQPGVEGALEGVLVDHVPRHPFVLLGMFGKSISGI